MNIHVSVNDSVAKLKRVRCPVPIVSNQTLFSASAWVNLARFAYTRLHMLGKETAQQEVLVKVRDIYFCKPVEDNCAVINNAEKIFSALGSVKRTLNEHHDRNDESNLAILIDDFKFRIYEYHNAICLATHGGATGQSEAKEGDFNDKKIKTWKTDIQKFLRFMEAVENTFLQAGQADWQRVFLTVSIGEAVTIRAEVIYEALPEEGFLTLILNGPGEHSRDHGLIPDPIEEVVFG